MNKIFKTIWNRARRCYVAVNETVSGAAQARGTKKKNRSPIYRVSALATLTGYLFFGASFPVFSEEINTSQTLSGNQSFSSLSFSGTREGTTYLGRFSTNIRKGNTWISSGSDSLGTKHCSVEARDKNHKRIGSGATMSSLGIGDYIHAWAGRAFSAVITVGYVADCKADDYNYSHEYGAQNGAKKFSDWLTTTALDYVPVSDDNLAAVTPTITVAQGSNISVEGAIDLSAVTAHFYGDLEYVEWALHTSPGGTCIDGSVSSTNHEYYVVKETEVDQIRTVYSTLINDGGNLTANSLNLLYEDNAFIQTDGLTDVANLSNKGIFTVDAGTIAISDSFVNSGTASIMGDLELTDGVSFVNEGTLTTKIDNIFDNATGVAPDALDVISVDATVPENIKEVLTELFVKYSPGTIREELLNENVSFANGKLVISGVNMTETQRDDLTQAFKEQLFSRDLHNKTASPRAVNTTEFRKAA